MEVKARISWGYLWRPGVFALATLVFGAWFFYDGFYAWPRERQIAREFAQFQAEGRSKDWAAYAAQRDWPDGSQGNPGDDHSDLDLMVQKVLGAAMTVVGLVFGVGFIRSLGRWIACAEQGIITSWGRRIAFDAITDLQLDRWHRKGIAVVVCDGGRLVLDDWKYDRPATEAIVAQVKDHLGIADEPE